MAYFNTFQSLYDRECVTMKGHHVPRVLTDDATRFIDLHKEIQGCCVPSTMSLINFLVSHCLAEGEEYLELGAYCGRTLIAGLLGNSEKAHVIDPFIHDNSAVDIYANLSRHGVGDRVSVNHMRWQQFIEEGNTLPNPIGVYFNDGDHGSDETYHSLNAFLPFLADKSIIVVDDLEMDPVYNDVDKWCDEHAGHIVFRYRLPFFMGQEVIGYEK